MTAALVLRFSHGQVLLQHRDGAWCDVRLVRSGVSEHLGAADFPYLRTQFLRFLEAPPHHLTWILTLSEVHCSMYGHRLPDGDVQLTIQDHRAAVVANVMLSASETRNWIATLQRSADSAR